MLREAPEWAITVVALLIAVPAMGWNWYRLVRDWRDHAA